MDVIKKDKRWISYKINVEDLKDILSSIFWCGSDAEAHGIDEDKQAEILKFQIWSILDTYKHFAITDDPNWWIHRGYPDNENNMLHEILSNNV